MSLTTPVSLQKLQTALHEKAKGSPGFRFYALYDKVYREDVLTFAYACCKANGGAAGVDGQRFEDIDEYGVKRWLDELTQELKKRTYRPHPVRRVLYSEAGWEAKAVRHTDGEGSRRANSSRSGAGADRRSRLAAGTICLSRRPQRTGRCSTGS